MSNMAVIESRAVAPAVSFDQQCRLAESFARSGLFGIKTADQALALMALCEAEGLHPAVAVRDYHIIQGKPALKADAMLARFQAAGGRVKWIDMTDERVAAEFSHPSGGTVMIDWDKQRAVTAGFWGKDNWKKFPRAMLRARVVSEGIRTVFPGVVVGVYTPEEVQDFDEPKRNAPAEQPRPQKQPYSQDAFDKNFDTWADLVESGKKTPAQIIALIESKATLSETQRKMIEQIGTKEFATPLHEPATPSAVDGNAEWSDKAFDQ